MPRVEPDTRVEYLKPSERGPYAMHGAHLPSSFHLVNMQMRPWPPRLFISLPLHLCCSVAVVVMGSSFLLQCVRLHPRRPRRSLGTRRPHIFNLRPISPYLTLPQWVDQGESTVTLVFLLHHHLPTSTSLGDQTEQR